MGDSFVLICFIVEDRRGAGKDNKVEMGGFIDRNPYFSGILRG